MNIVLVHGILGFSHLDVPLSTIDYFAGIAEHWRARFPNAAVIAPTLDPTAGISARSAQLREQIAGAIRDGRLRSAEPIHIIAHSMGGLDARELIANGPLFQVGASATPVATLVTISTPHAGSPVADLVALRFLSHIPGVGAVVRGAELGLETVLRHFRISLDGLHDLTSETARDFNTRFPDQHGVRYLSFAGKGRPGLKAPTSAFFLPYYGYVAATLRGREDNDGLVPISSARHGEFDNNLWPCDHADEIGHDLDRPLHAPDADTLNRFDNIVLRL
jgi:triacylglycerol lipase